MIITYTFDGIDFDYEISSDEIYRFIKRTYTDADILDLYSEYIYPKVPEKMKQELLDEYGFDGTESSIESMLEEDKEFLSQDVIEDLLEGDVFNDELKNYFEDDAYQDYLEYKDYDPYSYNGVRRDWF